MKKLTGNEIRNVWLNFFKEHGHHVEKGASLIPQNDPTLLWINSGVAALKKYMDGSEVPPCKRITNVQKSIRTNDIDNVGYTARHQTFFEMLGCFSIGDYFRNEIIPWAYDILTNEKYFGMDKDKLYFTYNPMDLDTFNLWQKCGVDKSHLIALEGNYWQIGTGPCGPNTEVFFDRGDKYDPEHVGVRLLEEEIENDRYIEIWGIVFSQYNAEEGKKRSEYKELPHKNIDTGAGLERIASILQETESNFETDLLFPLIKKTEEFAKIPYGKDTKTPYRVIADHIRAISFAVGDGENFSNEGRGYILRRLLRRATKYARKIGIEEPFLYKLVHVTYDINKEFYPDYLKIEEEITKKVLEEEEKFVKTLANATKVLDNMLKELPEGTKELSGKDAFLLFDTFGLPLDLQEEILSDKGLTIDVDGFNKAMEEQKERAREAREDVSSMNKQSKDLMEFNLPSTFYYEDTPLEAKVIGLFKDGVKVDELTEEGEVILDQTNFYAESGGEVSDTGYLRSANFEAEVIDTKKAPNKEHLHFIKITKGSLKVGDVVTTYIDAKRRKLIERNHSATHLLQSMINKVLGVTVKQMGSFVNDEYLRFDFSLNHKISDEDLVKIEDEVNNLISEAIPSDIRLYDKEEALKLDAKMFFMDKYGEKVRVVKFGDCSTEFCGGAHVKNTIDIGLFKITKEESIANGVRRIEARTSLGALKFIHEKESLLGDIRTKLDAKSNSEILTRISTVLDENDGYKKEITVLKDRLAALNSKALKDEFIDLNGYKVLTKHLKDEDSANLIKLGDTLKVLYPDYVIILSGGNNDNVPLTIFVGGKALEKNNAGTLIRTLAMSLGGSGGGRPNMANGRGKDASKIKEAFDNILKEIK